MVAQMVKNPPAIQETWIQSLGWENPLAKEMVIRCSILFFIIFIKKKFFLDFMAAVTICSDFKWKWSRSVMSDSLQPYGL